MALLSFALTGNVAASSAVGLGTADAFAVLGGSTVTNTGPSVINGDLGVSPGSAVTGFPPGIVNGTIHAADATAAQAQADLTTAYNNAAGQACDTDLTGQDLGGLTLTAGVYCFSSSAGLTGTLTLNAQGNSGALFIFQIGSTLTTASASRVRLINGARPCNVFWQVGSSAVLGTTTSFVGNIMALTSITMTTGATLQGRALAQNGAVTLDTNVITKATCDANTNPGGDVGGPCADPAYYGVFDNTASATPVLFRMRWNNGARIRVDARWVPGGSIYRTWEHWAKPGTKVMVGYRDADTGRWVNLDSAIAASGYFPPCVYQHGYETP
ncbi:MAG TPA: ice-binding family protein [Candidatus Limnocylindria bacterium]|nr:ice-binding family protein [Candidatus Limnocylindria bacterium]